MLILTRYLSRLFLLRLLLFLGGASLFVLALDLLPNADEILSRRQGGVSALLEYSVLRLPDLVSDVAKFACLLAGLFTLTYLARNRELTAIWDAGVSQFGLAARLLPLALLLGGLQYWLNDQLVPSTAAQLRSWQVGENRAERIEVSNMAESAAWFRSGTDVVRVPHSGTGFGVLRDITIFQRDADGQLQARLDVGEARFRDGIWRLTDVSRRRVDDNTYTPVPDRDWEGGPDPAVLGRLATHPRYLDHAELGRLVRGEQQRFWATHLYSTWQHARLAGALTPLVLIVLLVALTQRIQRLGHVEYLFVSGLGLGFAFFIFSGVSLAMGEVGILPPPIAGWAPPLCFLAIAGAIAFWHEEVRVPAAAPEGGDRRR